METPIKVAEQYFLQINQLQRGVYRGYKQSKALDISKLRLYSGVACHNLEKEQLCSNQAN